MPGQVLACLSQEATVVATIGPQLADARKLPWKCLKHGMDLHRHDKAQCINHNMPFPSVYT